MPKKQSDPKKDKVSKLVTIGKDFLTVAKIALKNSSRPILGTVAVFPDNIMVATDSYCLLEVDNSKNLPTEEFPDIPGMAAATKATDGPLLFPVDELLKKQKFTKNNKTLPILNNGIISDIKRDDDGVPLRASIVTTDLAINQKNEYRLVVGQYPKYKEVFPKLKDCTFTSFDPKLLIKALTAFKASNYADNVIIAMPKDGPGPILFIGVDDNNNKRAVVMPTKIDFDKEIENNLFYKKSKK